MQSFYLTDTGKVRSHNEDSVIILANEEGDYLLALADGMGGHRAGEIASSIATSYLSKHFKETFHNMSKEDAIKWLREAVKKISTLIFKYVDDHENGKGMGTTLVVAINTRNYVLFGNIGDSSGYVMKNNTLHKITYDHTLVNFLVASGKITEEEAKDYPRKNILMKALGANDPIDIDVFDCDTTIDEILLASDGLTNMLTDEQIQKVLLSDLTTEEKVIRLVRKANNRGGLDNISVAYLQRAKEGRKE